MKSIQQRGEITAFLSLMFVLMISFTAGILEVSMIQVSKSISRLETDRAVFSIFGEYQSRLMDEYNVFAIEASYGTGDYSEDNIIRRMHYFGTQNTDHEITAIQYLTDNCGQAFREQVLAYMEQKYGISLIRNFTGLTAEWEKCEVRESEMKEEKESVVDGIRELEELSDTTDAGETENESENELENDVDPFECVNTIEKAGILSIVLPQNMNLSGKRISLSGQPSYRNLNTGRGSFPSRTNMDGIEEKLLFNEYILDKFICAVSGTEEESNNSEQENNETKVSDDTGSGMERSLSYETEYIISGKESDKENLESVLMKIFLIRLALNYTYILGDEEKKSEAGVLASALALLLLNPELSEMIKHLVLFTWAAGESVVDIRTLLAGYKVPSVKNRENWQLSLGELLTLGNGSEQIEGKNEENGMSYKDYLRIFLFLSDTDQVTMRTMDRVEENLKTEFGMEYFQSDQCVSKIQMNNTVQIYDELTYQYPVYFGYE